jgi:hypothetical protein
VTPFDVVRIAHIEQQAQRRPWLVTGLWADQAVGFIGGTPKSCKTWLSLELAVAVASGRPCLGRFPVTDPGPVLVYAAEDDAQAIRERVAGIAKARHVDLHRLAVGLIQSPNLRLDVDDDCQRLDATISKIQPRLLVLDPLVRLHRGDENSAAETSLLLSRLRQLQREHGVAIALVHHIRKSTSAQPGQALRGSGDLHAWSDSNLFLLRRKGRLQLHAEHRSCPAPQPLGVELRQDPLHLAIVDDDTNDGQPEPDDLAGRVLAALADQPMTRTDLRDHLRVRNARLGRTLDILQQQGQIQRTGGRLVVPRSRA